MAPLKKEYLPRSQTGKPNPLLDIEVYYKLTLIISQ